MLKSLRLRNFKSFRDSGPIELAPLTVFFGPNTAGKSNLIDGVMLMSRLASERTLSDAFGGPIRGRAIEAFRFEAGGLSGLLQSERASLGLEARIECGENGDRKRGRCSYEYRVQVALRPKSGELVLEDEYLATLTAQGQPKGAPSIERVENWLHIRRKGQAARPYKMDLGNFTALSDRRFSGRGYEAIEAVRRELSNIRAYYLDPRMAMRSAQAPAEVIDIGPLGEHIAPFLYRIKAYEHGKAFAAVERTLRTIIPSIEKLSVELNDRRGEVEIAILQDGTAFSSRVVSEGTLRVLALCCIAASPFPMSLMAFEEPENGIHPRRIELVARLLVEMAGRNKQVVVTTHSPLFVAQVMHLKEHEKAPAILYNVVREEGESRANRFEPTEMFRDEDIRKALSDPSEETLFQAAILRGLFDG